MNTIRSITGVAMFLTAFSATAAEIVVPYVLSASDPNRQSFVRVVWSKPGGNCYERSFSIRAYDDAGQEYGPIDVQTSGKCLLAHNFNSDDLEYGNVDKFIPHGLGAGEGDWRLILESEDEFEAYAYVRTPDGFLTAMHDMLPRGSRGRYFAYIFNPAKNTNQVSVFRIVNPNSNAVEVYFDGWSDDQKRAEFGYRSIPANGAIRVSAQELEAGSAIEDRAGKRYVQVHSVNEEPLLVLNLLETPTGHITNLSTFPYNEPTKHESSSASYKIDLVFASDVPDVVRTAARAGRTWWQQSITRGIGSADIEIERGECRNEHDFDSNVDDLVVFVAMEEVDNESLVGYSQVCAYYTQGGKRFTKAGTVIINKTRLDKSLSKSCRGNVTCRLKSWLEPLNSYPYKVMQHEIAHVIGFNRPHFEAAGYYEAGSPPLFTGPNAIRAYEESSYRGIGGLDRSDGIPLRSDGSHLSDAFITWRDGDPDKGPDQGSPLMGGDMNGMSDLSSVTLAALEDLGYRVDMDQAINRSTEPQEPVRIQYVP